MNMTDLKTCRKCLGVHLKTDKKCPYCGVKHSSTITLTDEKRMLKTIELFYEAVTGGDSDTLDKACAMALYFIEKHGDKS